MGREFGRMFNSATCETLENLILFTNYLSLSTGDPKKKKMLAIILTGWNTLRVLFFIASALIPNDLRTRTTQRRKKK